MKNKSFRIFCALMVLCIAFTSLCACSKSKAPKLNEVKERFSYLLDNSYEINEMLWGDGLPTIVYGSDEDKEHKIYDEKTFDGYEYIRDDCKYKTIEQIKTDAEKIYSKSYLKNIYVQIFDGYTLDSEHYNLAKYIENTKGFFCYSLDEDLVDKLVFDHSTMKIVNPSRADYVNVEISAAPENNPSATFKMKVSFILEDGEWYLDSPSF